MSIYITVHTNEVEEKNWNKEPRNVTLACNPDTGLVYLMGGLEHGTQITINQELVNKLQKFIVASNIRFSPVNELKI